MEAMFTPWQHQAEFIPLKVQETNRTLGIDPWLYPLYLVKPFLVSEDVVDFVSLEIGDICEQGFGHQSVNVTDHVAAERDKDGDQIQKVYGEDQNVDDVARSVDLLEVSG